MNYECSYDSISVTEGNDIQSFIYTIAPSGGSNPHVINPSVTLDKTEPGAFPASTCSVLVEYFYWDETFLDWKVLDSSAYEPVPFSNLDIDGTLTIDTN